jgi:hypothetical protein
VICLDWLKKKQKNTPRLILKRRLSKVNEWHNIQTFNGITVYDSFVQLKVKFVSGRTTKAYRDGGCKLLSVQILNIGTWGRRVVSLTHRCFTPRKNSGTHYTGGWLGPRAGLYGFGEVKIYFFQPGVEPRTVHPAASRYTKSAMPSHYYNFVVRENDK